MTQAKPNPQAFTNTDPLFSETQVIAITLMGNVLAGALLMALNFQKLGRPRAARQTTGIGLVLLVSLILTSLYLPFAAMMALNLLLALIVGGWYRAGMAADCQARLDQGAVKAPWSTALVVAFGTTLLSLVGLLGATYLVNLLV